MKKHIIAVKIPKMKISKTLKRYPFRTKVVKKITAVAAEDFNRIFPNVPERYHFLKTLDESGFDQFSFYYILVYDHKDLVAAAPVFLVNYSLDTSIDGTLRQLTNKIKKAFPKVFSFKALCCGIPMGQGHIALSKKSTVFLEVIEQRMRALARRLKAPFMAFKDFDDSYDEIFKPLLKKGYLKINSLPMTRLELPFTDFEEYLKHLSGPTRYDFRRKIKKTSNVNIELSQVHRLDEATLNEAYALYLQSVRFHDMGFEIVPKEFFRHISLNMPQETKFFLWRIDGKLACFLFCLVCDDILLDYYIGFDYALAHEHHLYFIRFKDVFNWCLDHGIKTYEMGSTGYEPKRRLNFKFMSVYLYVKIRYKILHPLLHVLCACLKFENFDPELKRWKKLK